MTFDAFKALPYDAVFATGIIPNMIGGLFMERSNPGRMLRWVAKKGQIDDWAIYVNWADEYSAEQVKDFGDKITGNSLITTLVPCDEPLIKAYRL